MNHAMPHPMLLQLTWTDYPKYRLWRKNLSKSSNSANVNGCLGVDLNRNFNIKWGTVSEVHCHSLILLSFGVHACMCLSIVAR